MQMVIETTVDDGTPVAETLSFSYDASGLPMSVVYNGTAYYYTVNLQGDVMAIVDATGTAVVSYTYDAWGNILSVTGSMADTLGESNPLRYRGYYYDGETELYYLQSRYYDPELGRFINEDSLISSDQSVLGNNLFAYCLNNPVSRNDNRGTTSVEIYDSNGNGLPDDEEFSGSGGNGGNNGIKIYRYGYDSPKKLVPTENDVNSDTGLSFSTKARPGSAVTTIEEVNSTGKLYAVQDSPFHVSVYPVGGTVGQWYDAGVHSIWTQALESVVVKN